MIRTIRIAGFGGQGVMLTGQLLAYAATKQGLYSLWVPTYGPETRGGTANCAITISDQPIHSPVFKKSDDLIVFNEPSFQKFGKNINAGGKLFYNKSLIKGDVDQEDINSYGIPMNDIANELDMPQVANMVMLGAYIKAIEIFDETVILESLEHLLGPRKKHLINVNQKAMQRGKECL
jgi:2-oxoglutarate ferredoxin oxidoreductase subunit gamma